MPEVTVKVTIGTFSVEVTGPTEYTDKKLEELLSRYLGSAKPAMGESQMAPALLEKGGKRISAAEFLKKAANKNQSDRAMSLAYYLEKVEGQTSFTTTELGKLGRTVKRPFTNISDTVGKIASRGLMMSSGEKEGQRAYALTATGEEYVESMLEPHS